MPRMLASNRAIYGGKIMKDGGPAFPTESERQIGPSSYHYAGMMLRDYFAAKAMAAFLIGSVLPPGYDEDARERLAHVATRAYEAADAMLVARLSDTSEGES